MPRKEGPGKGLEVRKNAKKGRKRVKIALVCFYDYHAETRTSCGIKGTLTADCADITATWTRKESQIFWRAARRRRQRWEDGADDEAPSRRK